MKIRVGQGFDFHPFQTGRPLLLGGVEIPYLFGLAGHSDADALLHAVADALLGAAGLGDIGTQFPDSDARYQGISSSILLREVRAKVEGKGFRVVNIDATVIAEQPRIRPHVEEMRANLSQILSIDPDAVGIKATTMEGCGTIGKGEGIAVQAVALLASGGEV